LTLRIKRNKHYKVEGIYKQFVNSVDIGKCGPFNIRNLTTRYTKQRLPFLWITYIIKVFLLITQTAFDISLRFLGVRCVLCGLEGYFKKPANFHFEINRRLTILKRKLISCIRP